MYVDRFLPWYCDLGFVLPGAVSVSSGVCGGVFFSHVQLSCLRPCDSLKSFLWTTELPSVPLSSGNVLVVGNLQDVSSHLLKHQLR